MWFVRKNSTRDSSRNERRPHHLARSFRPAVEHLEARLVLDAGDTLGTALATALGPIPGTYAVDGRIGDGPQGGKDVDIYAFQADAGQAITVQTSLPAGSTLGSVLCLFNAAGQRLAQNSFASGAAITNHRFQTSATYYIGVSGYSNLWYDPNVAGSGFAASQGDYHLDLNLFTPVADAAGDTLPTAQVTNVGPGNGAFSVDARIGDGLNLNVDVDLYRIEGAPGKGLQAALSSTHPLRLLDHHGNVLALHDEGSPAGSQISYVLTENQPYYISVSGYTYTTDLFNYHLDIALTDPTFDNVGDTLATALDTGLVRQDGVFQSTNTVIGDGFFRRADVDLYRLEANAGQMLTIDVSGSLYPMITLFNENGVNLGAANVFHLERELGAGVHYVGISGSPNSFYNPKVGGTGNRLYSTGSYRLDLNLRTPTPDVAGDTLTAAQETGVGAVAGADGAFANATIIGDGLYPLRDVDLYHFRATTGQALNASVSSTEISKVLRLFNGSGQGLVGAVGLGSAATLQDYIFTSDGDYYLGVSGYPNFSYNPNVAGSASFGAQRGTYQLHFDIVTPAPDVEGDTIAAAFATGLGAADGTFTHVARAGDGLYLGKDVDMYRLTALAGQVLQVGYRTPPGGIAGIQTTRLFDLSGNEIYPEDWTPNGPQFRFAQPGDYYLGVSGGNLNYDPNVAGTGTRGERSDYQVTLKLITATPDAAGDSLATALDTRLGPSEGSYARADRIGDGLFLGRDVDFYRFRGSAGQVLALALAAPDGGAPFDGIARLYDGNGNFCTEAFAGAPLQYTLSRHDDYLVAVSASPNHYYDPTVPGSGNYSNGGDYRLELRLERLTGVSNPYPGAPVQVLSGHGRVSRATGLPEGGNSFDQFSIHAWIDATGQAHGHMTWTYANNYLPGGGGQLSSGYPWQINVDTMIIDGNTIHVEGYVVSSGQQPGDVGMRVSFDIVLGENGEPDLLWGNPVSGGFSLR